MLSLLSRISGKASVDKARQEFHSLGQEIRQIEASLETLAGAEKKQEEQKLEALRIQWAHYDAWFSEYNYSRRISA